MKVLLLRDIKKVGKKGSVVEVKEGYARNFLIAQGFAKEAIQSNLKSEETNKKNIELKEQKRKTALNNFFDKNSSFEISRPANEEGTLFGSFYKRDFLSIVHNIDSKIDLKEDEIEMEHIKHTSANQIKIPILKKEVTLIIKKT